MNRALVTSSKYSPGNLANETLQALFVARHDLLNATLEDISDSIESKQSRFILLVGPRGSGKTHFTSLLHNQIAAGDEFKKVRDDACIVLFNEEEWGIASYLDFLMRIIEVLSLNSDNEFREVADRIRAEFDSSPEKANAMAEASLKSILQKSYLVLICENLNDIMHGLGSQGQKQWRTFIQENPRWVVFATAPKIGNEFQSQDKPFYGQFTIRYLNRLKIEDAIKLLVKKAKLDGRNDLANYLMTPTGRARVRAIHHLAGGNPRIYIVLSEFLTRESVEDLFEPFMQMADDLTPYYQDRLRQLAPRQRKIVEYLSRVRLPETISEIADCCLLTHQSTSKQIHELSKLGFVTRIKVGRNTYCELSEPLMRICIEIKDNRTKEIRLFVEFLQHWFSNRELKSRHDRLSERKVTRESLTTRHLKEAVESCRVHQPFLEALDAEGWECFDAEDYSGLVEIKRRLIDERSVPEDHALYIFALRESGEPNDAVSAGKLAAEMFPDEAFIAFEIAATYLELGNFSDAELWVTRALDIDGDNSLYLCLLGSILLESGKFRDVISNGNHILKIDPNHVESYMDMSVAYEELGDLENATKLAKKLVDHEIENGSSWTRLAYCLLEQSKLDEALIAIERANACQPKPKRAWKVHGRILEEIGSNDAAIKIYRKALKSDDQKVTALCRLSGAYLAVENDSLALKYGKQLLDIAPDHTHAYLDIGVAAFRMGKEKDGISAFESLIENTDRNSCNYLSYAFDVAINQEQFELASRISEAALGYREDDPTFLEDHVQALVLLKKHEQVVEFVSHTNLRLGFVSALFESLHLVALASNNDLPLVRKQLFEFVGDPDFDHEELDWRAIARVMLANEYDNQGPEGLFQAVKFFRTLSVAEANAAMADGLIYVSSNRTCCLKSWLDEWEFVFPKIAKLLEDVPECELPLEFLQTAVRYVGHGDEEALLNLPLELRELLLEQIADNKND